MDRFQIQPCLALLDEGVDIPQTDTAFILASSTVRREWVQRRGRILRQFPGKTVATLHDFVVVPPDLTSGDGQAVLRGELARAEEFTSLAENEWDNDGLRAAMAPIAGPRHAHLSFDRSDLLAGLRASNFEAAITDRDVSWISPTQHTELSSSYDMFIFD